MGKKRTRTAAPKKSDTQYAAPNHEHPQSLLDDVREARDVEFAGEKKTAERLKRRKIAQKRNAANNLQPGVGTHLVETSLEPGSLTKSGIDPKTTSRIIETAKRQRAEIRAHSPTPLTKARTASDAIEADLDGVGQGQVSASSSLNDSDDENGDDGLESRQDADAASDSGSEGDDKAFSFLDASKITDEEELALSMFSTSVNTGTLGNVKSESERNVALGEPFNGQRVMLADIILAKIREKEEADAKAAADAADPERAQRERKIAEVYGLVGNIMSKYKSGKVPKAFKVIAKQSNWEDLVFLTRPDEWSPAAVYVATRLLASNLRPKEVMRYYTDVLLPRCLEDISENKKLNYHLYRALSKAVYKPEAFCKGILFPLCEDQSCTLRQATIIGSVLAKVSIPMLHSAAALLYISQLPYSPQCSVIITSLIEKKYAMPYRVLDAVVEGFLRMKRDPRSLPLLWHQSLLSFAQRYKTELSKEQKEELKLLMRVQTHHAVTKEIRRELFSARNRGDLTDPDANTIAQNVASAMMVS